MALTDDQMDQLKEWAYELGKDGVLADPLDHDIISAVFDRAEIEGMRTEDEWNTIVTTDDMPATEDRQDIVERWEEGHAVWIDDGPEDPKDIPEDQNDILPAK